MSLSTLELPNAIDWQQNHTWCNFASILPVSVVRVTKTARSARVIKATLDSGLDLGDWMIHSPRALNFHLVFEWVIKFTASCCACSLRVYRILKAMFTASVTLRPTAMRTY